MPLKEILSTSSCLVIRGPIRRDELLARMVDALGVAGLPPLADPQAILEQILKREASAPTAFGLGVAIPHCFLKGLGMPRLGLASCRAGVDFGGPDRGPTYIVFLLVEDLSDRGGHNALMARIARLCKDTTLVRRLRGARTGAEIAAALAEEDVALQ